MDNRLLDRHLALAAVCQAATLVQEIARTGKVDEDAYKASIRSIVVTDGDSVHEILGHHQQFSRGLETLINQLGHEPQEKDTEVTRYIASLLGLERKLSRQQKSLSELGQRIETIQRQMSHMDLFDSQMISNLASVYSDVVSPVGPKIQVAGKPATLQQINLQHQVRALLLAGVRAAVLWRQLGGQRRQILFTRRKILAAAKQMLGSHQPLH